MLPTWKCLNCQKKFNIGEWLCSDGQSNHVVESKEYLLNDAPSDPGHPAPGSTINVALRDGRTRVCSIPPDKRVVVNGETQLVPGGYVEFIRGEFHTADPEIQYWLDKKGGFCTREQWNIAWLTEGQQLLLEREQLAGMRTRLENDRNELLSQTKQRVAGG
jgi:hypothetical protein